MGVHDDSIHSWVLLRFEDNCAAFVTLRTGFAEHCVCIMNYIDLFTYLCRTVVPIIWGKGCSTSYLFRNQFVVPVMMRFVASMIWVTYIVLMLFVRWCEVHSACKMLLTIPKGSASEQNGGKKGRLAETQVHLEPLADLCVCSVILRYLRAVRCKLAA